METILKGNEKRNLFKKMQTKKLGETIINNQGVRMWIIEYNNCDNVVVEFDNKEHETATCSYYSFRTGNVKSRFYPTVYGIGFIGNETCLNEEGSDIDKSYSVWHSMLNRCQSAKFQERQPAYKGCSICEEWHNYSNFKKWFYENYYEIEGQKVALDKDILIKGNKVYSPDTCVFVPQSINNIFRKNYHREEKSITTGVSKVGNKYIAMLSIYYPDTKNNRVVKIGSYDNEIEAFDAYKKTKEENIKRIADYYKDKIPKKLYDVMYKYEVKITD